MPRATLKNLHVPLPEQLYQRLRTEADRMRRPATELAREAIDRWLAEQKRQFLHDATQTYARETAGTTDDLDGELEASVVEHLNAADEQEKPAKRRPQDCPGVAIR